MLPGGSRRTSRAPCDHSCRRILFRPHSGLELREGASTVAVTAEAPLIESDTVSLARAHSIALRKVQVVVSISGRSPGCERLTCQLQTRVSDSLRATDARERSRYQSGSRLGATPPCSRSCFSFRKVFPVSVAHRTRHKRRNQLGEAYRWKWSLGRSHDQSLTWCESFGALSGSAANSDTIARGRSIMPSVETSISILANSASHSRTQL